MKVYKKLYQKNEKGSFYEVFELPEGMEIPNGDYVVLAPPRELKYPRWDFEFNTGWCEDKDSVITDLANENSDLKVRLDMTESALLDLADQLLSVKGGVG